VKQGATTIWERWDGQKPDGSFQDAGMNSFNHYAYGAIGEWMYRVAAGLDVDPEEPGYKHVLARPQPGGGLTSAEARLLTLYGEAASGWMVAGDRMTVSVAVPPNARGTVRLPSASLAGVSEGGVPVKSAPGVREASATGDEVVVEIGSGRYVFAYDAPGLARRLRAKGRFGTWTPLEVLLTDARAKAVLDRLLPGVGEGPFAEQARKASLQQMAPYAPALFTEEKLRALDEELGAIPD
jgi:hypothetical protein